MPLVQGVWGTKASVLLNFCVVDRAVVRRESSSVKFISNIQLDNIHYFNYWESGMQKGSSNTGPQKPTQQIQGWGTPVQIQGLGNIGQQSWVNTGQQQQGLGKPKKDKKEYKHSIITEDQNYEILTALDPQLALNVSYGNQFVYKLRLSKKSTQKDQQFMFNNLGNGKYRILSNFKPGVVASMQVPNGSTANGTQIFMRHMSNNKKNQQWKIEQVAGGYTIKSFCGKALDVEQKIPKSGSNVVQQDYDPNKQNQIWHIQPI